MVARAGVGEVWKERESPRKDKRMIVVVARGDLVAVSAGSRRWLRAYQRGSKRNQIATSLLPHATRRARFSDISVSAT